MLKRSLAQLLILGALGVDSPATAQSKPPAPVPTGSQLKPPTPDGKTVLADIVADAKGKPILLEFSATWCKPCKVFEAETLPSPEFRIGTRGIHFVVLDIETPQGSAIAKLFDIDAMPTFLALDATGKRVASKTGGPTDGSGLEYADELVAWLASHKMASALPSGDPSARDAAALYFAGRNALAHDAKPQALALFRKAVDADRQGAGGVAETAAWRLLLLQGEVDAERAVLRQLEAYAKRFPKAVTTKRVVQLIFNSPTSSPAVRRAIGQTWLKASNTNADQLNSLAYRFLEGGMPDLALAAAQRQLVLVPSDANAYDTLAEVLHWQGDQAGALAQADKAIALASAKDKQSFLDNRARFAKGKAADTATTPSAESPLQLVAPPAAIPVETAELALQQYRNDVEYQLGRVTAGCAGIRNTTETWTQLIVPEAGGKPTSVKIIDPDVSGALRTCLERSFAQADLPAPPAAYRPRLVIGVPMLPARK